MCEPIGLALAVFGVVVLLFGYVIVFGGQPFDCCVDCGDPMPDGYTATNEVGRLCRACSKRLGVKPWYWKDCLGDPYDGTNKGG